MYCFSKTRRLLTKQDFDQVFNKALKISTSEFTILYRKNELSTARLGFALAKKMVAKSHERNRLRRIIRESFRIQSLPAVDIIFLAKKGVDKKSNHALYSGLVIVWENILATYEK